ncbi:MAG: caspase family protein [Sulfurimonadaceae bacterium]|jgi:uncharacterized caspase-like protein
MYKKISFAVSAALLLSGCATTTPQINSKKAISPYERVTHQKKFQLLTNYLVNKELQVTKPTFPVKPKEPAIPHAQELVKGKYEKLATFEARVAQEKQKRAKLLESLQKQYAKEVQAYNAQVKRLTDAYNNELAKKEKEREHVTLQAMQRAYAKVYGTPYVDTNLKYDPESERFFAEVKATQGGFSEKVAIDVPIHEAEAFEKSITEVSPSVVFEFKDDTLVLKKIEVKKHAKTYMAMLSDVNFKPESFRVAVGGQEQLQLAKTPLLSASLNVSETDYALGAINYSKDPEIAQLQKKKYELEKAQREQKNSAQREAELLRQKEALEAQIAQLEQKTGGADDLEAYLKKAPAAKPDPKKWLFVVAIENYEFTDPVVYSANSAKRFKEVAQKRLGVPEKNTRFLLNEGATAAKVRHHLQEMLSRVKEGDTVYVYYSGHGVPVAKQENAPYMLAQDMSPEYVAEDERFKLQNIYKSLSDSKASKVVAFVDSCFSGGADNTALFKGVAATRLKPKAVTFDTQKMVVITAGSGLEYSNKYDEKSNRLFSYYVMRGLINNNENMQRLYDYVKSNVQEKSYEMGASYEQVPVFEGNIGLGL